MATLCSRHGSVVVIVCIGGTLSAKWGMTLSFSVRILAH